MAVISVIVPVYKVELYLRRCVDSILKQTFRDFELILIDDGSPDRCGEICDEYAKMDSRVEVIHRENGGLSVARNTGIELVLARNRSQYISFIDSDDVVAPDYFESLLAGMKDSINVTCVSPVVSSDLSDESFEIGTAGWRYINPEEYWCNFGRFPMSAWGKLYRIAMFSNIRYPVGKIHEDEFVTHLLVFNRPTIGVLEARKYGYRVREKSIMSCEWSERNLVRIDALKSQIEYFRQRGFMEAEVKTVERLCSQDFVRAILILNRHEYIGELRGMSRTYRLPILRFADVYKVVYPQTYKIRWYWARIIDCLRQEGLLGLIRKSFRKVV